MDGFPSGQRGQTVNLLQIASMVRIHHHPFDAGWSSLEARRAHNPKVTGSNPVPATLLADCQAQAHPSLASGLQTLRVSKFCFAEPLLWKRPCTQPPDVRCLVRRNARQSPIRYGASSFAYGRLSQNIFIVICAFVRARSPY